MRRLALSLAALVTASLGLGLAAPADAATTPPTGTPSLTCSGDAGSGPEPVLLVPGTTLDTATNYSWNYEKAFTAQGRAWCALDVPGAGMADIQVAGARIAGAIRLLRAAAGRKIEVLGYSQGGMSPRWALKYWPDTRADVDDLVAIDPSNHGTLDANPICLATCAPSLWQQRYGSHLLQALNAGGETFAGISYTVVWSDEDEVVVPNLGPAALSALHTGSGAIADIPAQSICPTDVSEHLTMGTSDPVAYAVVMDALTHPGPASAARVPRSVCGTLLAPEVDPLTFPVNFAAVLAMAGYEIATYPHTAAEPALASYAS